MQLLDEQRSDFTKQLNEQRELEQQLKEQRERHERLMDGQHEQMMELRKELASRTSSACP